MFAEAPLEGYSGQKAAFPWYVTTRLNEAESSPLCKWRSFSSGGPTWQGALLPWRACLARNPRACFPLCARPRVTSASKSSSVLEAYGQGSSCFWPCRHALATFWDQRSRRGVSRGFGLGGGQAFVPLSPFQWPVLAENMPFLRQSLDNNGIRVNNLDAGEQREQTHNAFFVSDSWVP